jgi:hypothetical protein
VLQVPAAWLTSGTWGTSVSAYVTDSRGPRTWKQIHKVSQRIKVPMLLVQWSTSRTMLWRWQWLVVSSVLPIGRPSRDGASTLACCVPHTQSQSLNHRQRAAQSQYHPQRNKCCNSGPPSLERSSYCRRRLRHQRRSQRHQLPPLAAPTISSARTGSDDIPSQPLRST